MNKDYSTISPSAKSLLRMKAHTSIPFMREAAAILEAANDKMEDPLGTNEQELGYWLRVMHFEERYLSINQLLRQANNRNVLELSSGFSFRGLDMVMREEVNYIDTDLPEIIDVKLNMVHELQAGNDLKGRLTTLPLNALDKAMFNEVTGRFEHGGISIVNEGLLMYLDDVEKRQLCQQIHALLKRRGGCWITADIYIQTPQLAGTIGTSDKEQAFMKQHQLERNKFTSFDAAREFFTQQGFDITAVADIQHEDLTPQPKMQELMTTEVYNKLMAMGKMRETWMLEVSEK